MTLCLLLFLLPWCAPVSTAFATPPASTGSISRPQRISRPHRISRLHRTPPRSPRLPLSPRMAATPTPPDATPHHPDPAELPPNANRPPFPSRLPGKWAVVVAASCVHALHGAAVYMVPTTLLSPMRQAMGLSVAEITRPIVAYRVVQAVFLIPAGLLIDAVGPQLLLRVSMTAAAISAPLLSFVTSLPQLMALQIFFSITKLFGGLSALLVVVSSAFPHENSIGTATGILLSGYSIAGFLAPTAIGTLSGYFGWRAASLIISLVFGLVALPLTYHFLRERPARPRHLFVRNLLKQLKAFFSLPSSLQPEHHASRRPQWHNPHLRQSIQPNPLQSQERTQQLQPLVPKHLAADLTTDKKRDPTFPASYILISIAVFALSFSIHIVFDHLLLFLSEDFGLPFERAAMFMSALNLIALFSKLVVGPLADRHNKSALVVIFSCVAAAGSLLLLDFSAAAFQTTTSLAKIVAFVTLYAVGYSSVFSVTTSMLPKLGKKKLGFRTNFNLVLFYGSGSLGSYLSAALRSGTGTYKWAFVYSACSWLVVLVAGLANLICYDRNSTSKRGEVPLIL